MTRLRRSQKVEMGEEGIVDVSLGVAIEHLIGQPE